MLDFNIIYAILSAAAIGVYVKFVKPYLKENNLNFYKEVKLFLLISGYAFRDDKIKAIAGITLKIVKSLEELTLASDEKHHVAIDKVYRELLDEFNIEMKEEVIEGIVRIAVSYLPPTNK